MTIVYSKSIILCLFFIFLIDRNALSSFAAGIHSFTLISLCKCDAEGQATAGQSGNGWKTRPLR
jgi:hypothetical protein